MIDILFDFLRGLGVFLAAAVGGAFGAWSVELYYQRRAEEEVLHTSIDHDAVTAQEEQRDWDD